MLVETPGGMQLCESKALLQNKTSDQMVRDPRLIHTPTWRHGLLVSDSILPGCQPGVIRGLCIPHAHQLSRVTSKFKGVYVAPKLQGGRTRSPAAITRSLLTGSPSLVP